MDKNKQNNNDNNLGWEGNKQITIYVQNSKG